MAPERPSKPPASFKCWVDVVLSLEQESARCGIPLYDDTEVHASITTVEFGFPMVFSELPSETTFRDLKAWAFDELMATMPQELTHHDVMDMSYLVYHDTMGHHTALKKAKVVFDWMRDLFASRERYRH